MSRDDLNPYAPTAHQHPPPTPSDCEAGTRALHLLVGDPHNPEAQSVFAQLRGLYSIVHELRTSARLVVMFAGVIAACTVWSVLQR